MYSVPNSLQAINLCIEIIVGLRFSNSGTWIMKKYEAEKTYIEKETERSKKHFKMTCIQGKSKTRRHKASL